MAALLVCAVFGSLFFSRVEMPNNLEILGRKPSSTGVFTPFGHTVYWLAEKTNILSKAKRNSSSVIWNGAPRALMPAGVQNAAECLIILLVHFTNYLYLPNINNAIPLKLRI